MGKASRRQQVRRRPQTSPAASRVGAGARSIAGRSRACRVRPTGSRCARSSRPPRPRSRFAHRARLPRVRPREATVATVLPLAWPGLHRADGTRAHRHAVGQRPRRRLPRPRPVSCSRRPRPSRAPRVTTRAGHRRHPAPAGPARHRRRGFEVTVHEGFDFWVGDSELDAEGKASLERANASVVPTTKMAALPSAYWVRIGERTHIRLVLRDDEDAATDALARLHAAGETASASGTRLLGAFRACGLLVPVWDLDPELKDADAYEDELAALAKRYAAALASTDAAHRRGAPGPLGAAQPPGHPALTAAPMTVTRRRRGHPLQGRGGAHRGDRRGACRASTASTWSSSSTTAAPTTPRARPGAGADVVRHPRNRGKAAAMRPARAVVARQERQEGASRSRRRRAGRPALRRRRPRGDRGQPRRAVAPGRRRHGRHDHRDPAAADDGRRRPGLRRAPGPARDRAAHRLPAVQPLSGMRCLTRAAFDAASPAGPRLGRRDRPDRRRAARRPARARGALRAAAPGQRLATGAASCTGPSSTATCALALRAARLAPCHRG